MKAHGANGSSEHYTPPWLVEIARKLMGGIDLDPCSCPEAQKLVRAECYHTVEDDGLTRPWSGRVLVNPPGGTARLTQKFWRRLFESHRAGEVEQACFVSFSLDTLQTTQRYTPGGVLRFPTWIPDRRFNYWNTDGEQSNAVRPSALTWLPPGHVVLPTSALQHAVKSAPVGGVVVKI